MTSPRCAPPTAIARTDHSSTRSTRNVRPSSAAPGAASHRAGDGRAGQPAQTPVADTSQVVQAFIRELRHASGYEIADGGRGPGLAGAGEAHDSRRHVNGESGHVVVQNLHLTG